MADHYEILGVARNASGEEIRRTYLKLAKERHPDRFTDAAEKKQAQDYFQAITEAFNTLINEQRRRAYDEELEKPQLQEPAEIARDAYERAQKYAESRADQEAVDLLHVAIHHMPNEPLYHAALARLLSRHPKHARDAVASLEKAVQLDPQNLAYHLELAFVLLSQGLKIRAQKALEPALRMAPRDRRVVRLASELGLSAAPPAEPAKGVSAFKGFFGKKS